MHTSDAAEFEKTVAKYKRTVYGIAVTRLNDRQDADDVFQEVFLLYFTKDLHFENEESKRAWLIRTTIFKCRQYNYSDRNIDREKEIEQIAAFGLDPAEETAVYAAVKHLPPKYREAVYLHYFLGMPINEAAEILDIKPNTLSMRLSRAKKLLKKELEGDSL